MYIFKITCDLDKLALLYVHVGCTACIIFLTNTYVMTFNDVCLSTEETFMYNFRTNNIISNEIIQPERLCNIVTINPYPADHDFCRFHLVLSVDQVTFIGNEMCVYTSKLANFWSQIKQICIIFTYLKLWVAVARHNFK